MSRAYESEADWRGLPARRATPTPTIGLQQGLVERSLGVPDTPEAVQVWFGTPPDRARSGSGSPCAHRDEGG